MQNLIVNRHPHKASSFTTISFKYPAASTHHALSNTKNTRHKTHSNPSTKKPPRPNQTKHTFNDIHPSETTMLARRLFGLHAQSPYNSGVAAQANPDTTTTTKTTKPTTPPRSLPIPIPIPRHPTSCRNPTLPPAHPPAKTPALPAKLSQTTISITIKTAPTPPPKLRIPVVAQDSGSGRWILGRRAAERWGRNRSAAAAASLRAAEAEHRRLWGVLMREIEERQGWVEKRELGRWGSRVESGVREEEEEEGREQVVVGAGEECCSEREVRVGGCLLAVSGVVS